MRVVRELDTSWMQHKKKKMNEMFDRLNIELLGIMVKKDIQSCVNHE